MEKRSNSISINLKKYNVEFYLSDGFVNLNEIEFDLAIICGMGPHTIINILKKSSYNGKKFLLGCQGKIYYLIDWLEKNGFIILNYYVVFDKFYYVFLKVLQNNYNYVH
ncbi:hypothetical protein FEF22_000060 [Texas Phoenix palm phytoplasma]|uniref:Uncharacterized protein n=1 Tax=Texas Phoenix palm phytoplasma TaxID=176709 RepID=A0ABS5BHV6_9MOLU|nr:tRNA (adenine(22)-N(1))-methyltransferase TrmK [Texas Phoenix palm phytoplasma]MBP3059176.1 hypothetical protein [Texas Phoenix palm phytoplasma]MBP3059185.1 hypothetical protein [Texas Phoenix palm phytoplasma]